MGSARPLVAQNHAAAAVGRRLCIGKAAQLQIKAVAHRANDLRRTRRALAMLLSDQSVKRIVLSLQMSNSPTSI
jgi:hypothetical protein